MNGSYLLLLRLDSQAEIAVGHLGRFQFAPGFYAYSGSALAGIEARIARHRQRGKKLRWHIDYLTERAELVGAWVFLRNERIECSLAAVLRELSGASTPVARFGSSDCRCLSHLIYLANDQSQSSATVHAPPHQTQRVIELVNSCVARFEAKEFRRAFE